MLPKKKIKTKNTKQIKNVTSPKPVLKKQFSTSPNKMTKKNNLNTGRKDIPSARISLMVSPRVQKKWDASKVNAKQRVFQPPTGGNFLALGKVKSLKHLEMPK